MTAASADQIVMGVGVAVMCVVGLRQESWLLDEWTPAQWLRRQWGDGPASTALRTMLIGGVTFGVLLASGVVNPIGGDGGRPAAAEAAR